MNATHNVLPGSRKGVPYVLETCEYHIYITETGATNSLLLSLVFLENGRIEQGKNLESLATIHLGLPKSSIEIPDTSYRIGQSSRNSRLFAFVLLRT